MDWRDMVEPLVQISEWMNCVFATYVFFTLFCCLNIITAIFVENAQALKRVDEDAMHEELMKEKQVWCSEVADLFAKVDASGEGIFTFDDFKRELATNFGVQTCFKKLGIDVSTSSAEELWELFDIDDSGEIDIDEFAAGIVHFHGSARSIDIFKIRKDNRSIANKIEDLHEKLGRLLPARLSSTLN
eukprot:TRINITY_DN35024_c0_g1_i1.p1 TRINITY_DN35024_c0_g1~~TRINITY_DN35024_c0_g1_i1.p1  ORF type:complete len:218 (+),score=46.72 TRINITY_DN35024_c0_g1_i1:96-656(+)